MFSIFQRLWNFFFFSFEIGGCKMEKVTYFYLFWFDNWRHDVNCLRIIFFYIQSTSLDKAIFFNETVFFVIIWCTFANYQCKVHKCKLLVLKKYYYGIHFKQLKKQTGKHLFQSFIDSTRYVHWVYTRCKLLSWHLQVLLNFYSD